MSDTPKRKISAKQILDDIRLGMNKSDIEKKFELSDREFETVMNRLSVMGLLEQPEIPPERSEPKLQSKTPQYSAPVNWRCPSCGTPQVKAYEECPHCGIIAAKFAERHLHGHGLPQSHNYEENKKESSFTGRWPLVLISILCFIVVGGALLKWSSGKKTRQDIAVSVTGSGDVRNFTVSNFEQDVKEASKAFPVLVTFYAHW